MIMNRFDLFTDVEMSTILSAGAMVMFSPGPVYMSAHSIEFSQFEVRMLFIGPWCT